MLYSRLRGSSTGVLLREIPRLCSVTFALLFRKDLTGLIAFMLTPLYETVSLEESLLCSKFPLRTWLLKQTQWISELSSLYIYPAGWVVHALVWITLIGENGRVSHRLRATLLVAVLSDLIPPISSAFLTSESACLGWR